MPKKTEPTWCAFPEDGFIALEIPREYVPVMPKEASGFLVRIKSAEGFRNYITAAMEAARLTWPEVDAEYLLVNIDPSGKPS